jgi:glucan biosynthesis protein C
MSQLSSSAAPNRLLFFDNVRYVVIIWVTIFHVASGLSGHPEFIRDSNTSFFFVIFHGYSVTVMMAIMFFSAGYFSTRSLQGRSTGAFLKNKLFRLGLPWLVGVVLLGPTMPYMAYYSRSFAGLQSDSYWDFWLQYMGSGLANWHLPISFTANTLFHHQHFWFLSVLFVYFVVHALLRDTRQHWGWPALRDGNTGDISQWQFARAFLLTALVIVVGMASTSPLDLPSGTFAFFFTFNTGNVFLYGPIFSLAVYAHSRGWYANGQAPGWKAVGILVVALLVAAGAAAAVFFTRGQESPLLMFFGMSAAVLVNLLSVLAFTSLIFSYMNKPSALNAHFAANSYNVYLVQYPVVLVFRLMSFSWEVSPFIKFFAASIPALLVSYVLSEYLIRPRPRLAVFAAVAMSAGLCLFGLPRTSFSHQLLDRQEQMHAIIPAAELVPLMEEQGSFGGPPWNSSAVSLAWQDGVLYYGSGAGLQVMRAESNWQTLNDTLAVSGLASLGDDRLAVSAGGSLVLWSGVGQAISAIGESGEGSIDELVADGRGGFFYTVVVEEQTPVLKHWDPAGETRVTEFPVAGAGALGADGQTLLWTADGQLKVQTFAMDAEGGLSAQSTHAEVFMADGKYSRDRPQRMEHTVNGMTSDRAGRLFLVNRVGLQVFDAQGQLLGVVQFPEEPSDCVFGGEDLSTLYVATDSQVYALRTTTMGVPPSGVRLPRAY